MRRGAARLLACGAAALLGAGCGPALRPLSPPGEAASQDPAALSADVLRLARRIEHEPSAARRGPLAEEALRAGQRCEQAAPGTPPCDYALAIALGLEARQRPATALDGLARMAALLRRAAAAEPGLDQGGPDRVLALLLVRAPGWPLGPGDPDEALAAARRAVALAPLHPPNELALAEALVATGDRAAGREAARRALRLAEAAQAAGEPDAAGWRKQALALEGAP